LGRGNLSHSPCGCRLPRREAAPRNDKAREAAPRNDRARASVPRNDNNAFLVDAQVVWRHLVAVMGGLPRP
jgi:hypothetical protein